MSVTQQEIAARARVSITLVNFVLNGRAEEKKVNPRTALRIEKAARDLGYRGNYLAQALSRGRTHTIGLASVGSLTHRMWGSIAGGAETYARRHAYNVLFIGSSADEGAAARGMRFLDEKRIDALIVAGGAPRMVPPSRGVPGPAVFIGPRAPAGCASVWMDPAPGIRAAIAHLAELGHRRILYIGKQGAVPERVEAFRAASRDSRVEGRELYIEPEQGYFEELERHIAHCHERLSASLALDDGTTAVLCYNDTLALALYAVLQERGLRIPRDISVIGFDDLHASHAFPALSSVSHMFVELGEKAAQAALEWNEELPEANSHVLPAKLVLRASTGPARSSTTCSGPISAIRERMDP